VPRLGNLDAPRAGRDAGAVPKAKLEAAVDWTGRRGLDVRSYAPKTGEEVGSL
jgi:hypothetical protein